MVDLSRNNEEPLDPNKIDLLLNKQIAQSRAHLISLKAKERMCTPTSRDFHKCIAIRFNGIYQLFPKKLVNNLDLRNWMMLLFVFYAGQIYEDAQETGLYKGPAIHRVKTILNQYLEDLIFMDNTDMFGDASLAKYKAYLALNSLGKSK